MDSWLDWGEMELANPPLQIEQVRAEGIRAQGPEVRRPLLKAAARFPQKLCVWVWLWWREALETLEKHLDQRAFAPGP